jgi:hypothetical protein
LQRIEGAADETKFAIVVVLDDYRPASVGPREQRRAPFERHCRTARKLVRRRDVDDASVSREGVDLQPVIVHRHAHNVRAMTAKEEACVGIPGILHRDARALGDEHAPDQIERLLRTLGDQNIGGICSHRA